MQNFHYRFLTTDTDLSLIVDQLQDGFDSVAEKIVDATEEVEVDVVVRSSPDDTIPELGIAGQYTKEARCIDIYLDLENEHLKDNLKNEIARTLIHEYMHVAREKYIPWENGTLLDSLIAEGLSQCFELEMRPDLSPSIYSTAFTDHELDDLWDKAQECLDQQGPMIDEWFFGGGTPKRWSGYALGFKLVQTKMRESGLRASELYKLPATDFLVGNTATSSRYVVQMYQK